MSENLPNFLKMPRKPMGTLALNHVTFQLFPVIFLRFAVSQEITGCHLGVNLRIRQGRNARGYITWKMIISKGSDRESDPHRMTTNKTQTRKHFLANYHMDSEWCNRLMLPGRKNIWNTWYIRCMYTYECCQWRYPCTNWYLRLFIDATYVIYREIIDPATPWPQFYRTRRQGFSGPKYHKMLTDCGWISKLLQHWVRKENNSDPGHFFNKSIDFYNKRNYATNFGITMHSMQDNFGNL